MRNIESQIQQACVKYFRLQYHEYAPCFFSVPNGGYRTKTTAINMKREGALAGVSDLILLVPNKHYHALLIEMKTDKGRQQDTQKIFQQAVEKRNYKYIICRSLEDFIREIKIYLSE